MEKGTCGVCNRRFTLTKNKFLRSHGHNLELRNLGNGKRISNFCKGSGYLPIEISNETLIVSRNISRARYSICRDKYGYDDGFTTYYFKDIINDSLRIKNWKPIEERANA